MHLPDISIISADYRIAITRLASSLPRVGLGCFEIRLDNNNRVDFQICPILKNNEFSEVIQYLKERSETKGDNTPYWMRLYDFCSGLVEKKSFANGLVTNIWLVYDFLHPQQQNLSPWLYIGLPDFPVFSGINSQIGVNAITNFYSKLDENIEEQIGLFQSYLPNEAYLCAVGFKDFKKLTSVRLAYKFKRFDELTQFLKTINWQGNAAAVYDDYLPFFKDDNQISLAFDLGQNVSSKIGIERSFRPDDDFSDIYTLAKPIVNQLHVKNKKLEALKSWHKSPNTTPSDFNCKTWLNHIKLVFDSNELIDVKGYLFYEEKD